MNIKKVSAFIAFVFIFFFCLFAFSNKVSAQVPFPGDLDGDGDVDIFDYNQLVSVFGWVGQPGAMLADIDQDGDVDIFDYNTLVTNFGTTAFPPPTLTTPNGGEVWQQGSTYQITWEQVQPAASTGLFCYTRDLVTGEDNYVGAVEYNVSNVEGINSHSWTIPTSGPASCRISGDNIIFSVGQYDANQQLIAEDKSDLPFTIVEPQFPAPTLTTPNGGEVWEQGNTYQITWEQAQTANSTGLFFYAGGNYVGAIAYNVSNAVGINYYSWTIPTSGPECCWTTGDNITLSVGQYDANQQLIAEDKSDSTFTIVEPDVYTRPR